jgi:hypothetical protein
MFSKTIRQGQAHPECYLDVSLPHSHSRPRLLDYSSKNPSLNKQKDINEAPIVKGDLAVPPTP